METKLAKRLIIGITPIPLLVPTALWLGIDDLPVSALLFSALLSSTGVSVVLIQTVGSNTVSSKLFGSPALPRALLLRKLGVSVIVVVGVLVGIGPRLLASIKEMQGPLVSLEGLVGVVVLGRGLIWIWKRR